MTPVRTMQIALVAWVLLTGSMASATEQQSQRGEKSGTTVEDVTRGLKQAANNVEKEIPKIGAAIGAGLQKLTGSDKSASSSTSSKKSEKK
ncbi:MAG: hypothetical protein U0172_04970 [Nitrospiraceae bacterium]